MRVLSDPRPFALGSRNGIVPIDTFCALILVRDRSAPDMRYVFRVEAGLAREAQVVRFLFGRELPFGRIGRRCGRILSPRRFRRQKSNDSFQQGIGGYFSKHLFCTSRLPWKLRFLVSKIQPLAWLIPSCRFQNGPPKRNALVGFITLEGCVDLG